MTTARALAGLTIAAALVSIAPAAAQAATGSSAPATTAASASSASSASSAPKQWGPYYAPGKKAKASGQLSVSNLDTTSLPPVVTAQVSGKVTDYTKSASTCGVAVFRITYRKTNAYFPFTHKSFWSCGKPKAFSFPYKKVAMVELKVCSEAKAAKPSDNCLYAGTWKVLYFRSA